MINRLFFCVLTVVVLAVPGRTLAQTEHQSEEEAAAEAPRIVVLASGDAESVQTIEGIAQSVGQVAEERGYELVDPERVQGFVNAMDTEPESRQDLASVARFLGASAVLAASTRKATERELMLTVKVVFVYEEATGGEEARIVTLASAGAQARAMTRKVLPMAGDEPAAESAGTPVIGALPTSPTVPAVPVSPAVQAMPVAPVTAIPATPNYPMGAHGDAGVVMLPEGHMAPRRPSDEELHAIPPGRVVGGHSKETGRVLGVFGLTAAVQGGLWAFSLIAWVGMEENNSNDYPGDNDGDEESKQRASNIGYVYLGVAPALSSILGWAVGNGSDNYNVKYGPVVGGAYAGSVAAFGVMMLGQYSGNPITIPWGYVFGPILLPAAGAAIGYALGRTFDEGPRKLGMTPGGPAIALGDNVHWTLPQPVIAPSMDGSKGAYVGLSMGTLYF